jgi:hypothetical protein
MLERIHERLGTAGFVISIVALVAALTGAAYAASALTGKQKKEVTKIAKKYAGKPGATGAIGPAGSPGAKGDAGATGLAGADGADGKSVTVTKISPGTPGCEERGGALVKPEGAAAGVEVCNGEAAEGGGFPETLPSEATETGAWRFVSEGETEEFEAISFAVPLSEADAAAISTGVVNSGNPTADCPGTVEEPKAEPGFLCLYNSAYASSTSASPAGVYQLVGTNEETEGVGTAGALLYFEGFEVGKESSGTFAIAAP